MYHCLRNTRDPRDGPPLDYGHWWRRRLEAVQEAGLGRASHGNYSGLTFLPRVKVERRQDLHRGDRREQCHSHRKGLLRSADAWEKNRRHGSRCSESRAACQFAAGELPALQREMSVWLNILNPSP
jgi:hypothetical protein